MPSKSLRTVTGELVDSSNNPLPGLRVKVCGLDQAVKTPSIGEVYDVKTNGQGKFNLKVKMGEKIYIKFPLKASGGALDLLDCEYLYCEISSSPVNLGRIHYGTIGIIEVLVEDDSSKPVPNIPIKILDIEGKTIDSIITNQEGKFSFRSGDQTVILSLPEIVPNDGDFLELSNPKTNKIMVAPNITSFPAIKYKIADAQISLHVTDGTNGVDIQGILLRINGSNMPPTYQKNGNYIWSNLPAGPAQLILPPETPDKRLKLQTASRITITTKAGSVTPAGIAVYKPEEHKINWTVKSNYGRPVQGCKVEVFDNSMTKLKEAFTDINGRVEFDLGKAGIYNVTVTDDQGKSTTTIVTINSSYEGDSTIVIPRTVIDGIATSPISREPIRSVNTNQFGHIVDGALSNIIGQRVKTNDTKSFVQALSRSFIAKKVQGRTEYVAVPRIYSAQSDLAGDITGVQGSLYTRAMDMQEKIIPLLNRLHSLTESPDEENIEAIRSIVVGQINELVSELGMPAGPTVARIDQIFNLLLDETSSNLETVAGQLGELRDVFGLKNENATTIEEEKNITDFYVIVDYLFGLRQSWRNNQAFFNTDRIDFLGVRLNRLRQNFSYAESIAREAHLIISTLSPSLQQQLIIMQEGGKILIDRLLSWVERFSSEEGPYLIREGGKLGLSSLKTKASDLKELIKKSQSVVSSMLSGSENLSSLKTSLAELQAVMGELERLSV